MGAMAASKAAALLIEPDDDAAALACLQRDLLPRLADRNFALVVKDRPDLADAIKADGVHLSDVTSVKKLRSKFAGLSIGVACPLERHVAMIAAEQGADYVAFNATEADIAEVLPIVQWWGEMMTVPSVVFAETAEKAQMLSKAGADFIAVPPGIWQHPDPLKSITGFVTALA